MIRKKCYLFCVFAIIFALFLVNSFLSSKQTANSSLKWSHLQSTNRKSDNDLVNNDLASSNEPNYLDDSDDHVFWFVQISDLHLSLFHDADRITDLEYFCKEVLSFIRPPVVVASGDLTDSKNKDHTSSKQYEFEWKTYSRVISESKVEEYSKWLDVRGNHDNFDVADRLAPNNYYRKYGRMNAEDRSYFYEYKTDSGDKYSFIGVDACVEPGPRRPFNFFGNLKEQELTKLKGFADESAKSNGTIWFGHYPTSTILHSSVFRNIMTNGVAYLCGHLHTLGGLMPAMYSRHHNGILELELGDWKHGRAFRIMAFDAGLFSFRDFQLGDIKSKKADIYDNKNDIYILVTNPKSNLFRTTQNREPLDRMKSSTHVRVLVFSKYPVNSVQVFIDDLSIGLAKQVKDGKPLYVVKWNPADYLDGSHIIKVVVKDTFDNLFVSSQDFSLDNTLKPFKFFPTLLIRSDQMAFTRFVFYFVAFSIILVLAFFRYNRSRFTIGFVSCGLIRTLILKYLRRLALLSSIDYIYSLLIISTVYVAIGPWFVGEILENRIGVCFAWGIFVKGTLLSVDFQYLAGTIHLIFFQCLLMFHLSFQIEKRFMSMKFHEETQLFGPPASNYHPTGTSSSNGSLSSSTQANNSVKSVVHNLILTCRNLNSLSCYQMLSAFKYIICACICLAFENMAFVLLLFVGLFQMYDLYLSYSLMAILICPIKTWMLVLAIYLRYKATCLNTNDFNKFIDTSKFRPSINHTSVGLNNGTGTGPVELRVSLASSNSNVADTSAGNEGLVMLHHHHSDNSGTSSTLAPSESSKTNLLSYRQDEGENEASDEEDIAKIN